MAEWRSYAQSVTLGSQAVETAPRDRYFLRLMDGRIARAKAVLLASVTQGFQLPDHERLQRAALYASLWYVEETIDV